MLRLSNGLIHVVLALTLALTVLTVAIAEEKILTPNTGGPDSYEYLKLESHFVKVDLPRGWKAGYGEEVQFYGQRYGEVKGLKGTIVIWGPEKQAKVGSRTYELGYIKKIYSKQFDLSVVPEQPGWFTVPIDPVSLPPTCGVSVYTASDEQRGVKLALTPKGSGKSQSSSMYPGQLGTDTPIKTRRDGRDWLIRLKIRDTLAPPAVLSSQELGGPNFIAFDDGTAEDFITVQKKGFLLRCDKPGGGKVSSVFVFGKLDGNWLGSTRGVSVVVLDKDLKLLSRTSIPYSAFTNVPSWAEAHFSPVTVGPLHYIAIEPSSRPSEQFLLGYDTGSSNKASGFGTIGAELAWPFQTPAEDKTNWMIRVQYAP